MPELLPNTHRHTLRRTRTRTHTRTQTHTHRHTNTQSSMNYVKCYWKGVEKDIFTIQSDAAKPPTYVIDQRHNFQFQRQAKSIGIVDKFTNPMSRLQPLPVGWGLGWNILLLSCKNPRTLSDPPFIRPFFRHVRRRHFIANASEYV